MYLITTSKLRQQWVVSTIKRTTSTVPISERVMLWYSGQTLLILSLFFVCHVYIVCWIIPGILQSVGVPCVYGLDFTVLARQGYWFRAHLAAGPAAREWWTRPVWCSRPSHCACLLLTHDLLCIKILCIKIFASRIFGIQSVTSMCPELTEGEEKVHRERERLFWRSEKIMHQRIQESLWYVSGRVYKKPQSEAGNQELREPHKTRSAKMMMICPLWFYAVGWSWQMLDCFK